MKGIAGICAFCFSTLLLPWAAQSSDVTVFSITKGFYYEQTGAASPTVLTNNGYVFEANVFLNSPGALRTAFIQPPGGTDVALDFNDTLQYQLRDKFNTRAKLDTRYPDGSFVMTLNTVNDGNRGIVMPLVGAGYPTPPHVVNFVAGQQIIADGYFKLVWDPMNGGDTSDFIQFRIEDLQGNKIFETHDFGEVGALNGTATFVWIEPGTLKPGKTYAATLRFQRNVTINRGYAGSLGPASYFARTSFPLVTSSAAAPDVVNVQLSKSRSFVQVDAATIGAETNKEYTFEAKINGRDPNLVRGGSIVTPTGNTLTLTPDSDNEDFDYSASASSQGLFDSQFFNGSYSFSINTLHDGLRTLPLSLPASSYPPAPHIINFDAAQAIRGDFRVQWDAWTDGRDTDWIQLRIEDNDNNTVFKTADLGEKGALDGRATGAIVPAGELTPGKSYRGRVYFHRILTVEASSYPGVLSFVSFYSKTKFDMEAAPPDVKSLNILKGHEFVQTSSAAPSPNVSTAFVFTASIVADDVGTVRAVSIVTPRGAVGSALLQPDGKTFFFRDGCDDQVQVDAAYPDGTYTLRIDTAHDGLVEAHLTLSGANYPNAPRLADFSRVQLVEPANTLILNWDSFAGGTTNDFIQLEFENLSGNVIYGTKSFGKSSALDGTVRTMLIPNGTFVASQLYHASLLFQKTISVDSAAYPGADVWSGYFSRTRFNLTTAGQDNPPRLTSLSFAPDGHLSLTLQGLAGASYRIDCSTNLVDWTPLGTTALSGTTAIFEDPTPASRPCFFYRAVLLP